MKEEQGFPSNGTRSISYIMNTKNWWQPLLFILIFCVAGVGLIGYQTYVDTPPMTGFKTTSSEILMDKTTIENGQKVFHKYALMEYGSFFGDGAQRGPDVILDLFPAGAIQFQPIVDNGLWFARSEAFIGRGIFKSLTWLRGVGASLFFFGGVIPLTWFIVSRVRSLESASNTVDEMEALPKGETRHESQTMATETVEA